MRGNSVRQKLREGRTVYGVDGGRLLLACRHDPHRTTPIKNIDHDL
jgi:hypothetical protein